MMRLNKRQDNKLEKLLHLVGDLFELNDNKDSFSITRLKFLGQLSDYKILKNNSVS
jgi:hypothetical protein